MAIFNKRTGLTLKTSIHFLIFAQRDTILHQIRHRISGRAFQVYQRINKEIKHMYNTNFIFQWFFKILNTQDCSLLNHSLVQERKNTDQNNTKHYLNIQMHEEKTKERFLESNRLVSGIILKKNQQQHLLTYHYTKQNIRK